ncbi:hypothetical protein THAOC_01159 [Thalassiosira oceanica]|uniref:Uncharacterized protein n=1 Tax=Thalassiosira oceanica TaxID=159749 RepID=K0TND1_THAOC|nr:hypothetical protein THAOC_01159 [Thalassiosira oceanica]|eukprot:EJK77036.1 hypothetical protein THAOC_01159 [Thalassiosira oceanica]
MLPPAVRYTRRTRSAGRSAELRRLVMDDAAGDGEITPAGAACPPLAGSSLMVSSWRRKPEDRHASVQWPSPWHGLRPHQKPASPRAETLEDEDLLDRASQKW